MINLTYKLDLNYMATYTALFNEVVIWPDYKQLEIINAAIKVFKNKEDLETINLSKEIKYLLETWDEKATDHNSILEKLLYLQLVAQNYLENKEIENAEKEVAAQEDYKALSVKLELLINTLKDIIAENAKLASNRINDTVKFNRINECFSSLYELKFDNITHDDIYYYVISNKEFGDLLFTSCLRCWDLKHDLLWVCINRKDITLVEYYMNIMKSMCSCKCIDSEWNYEASKIVSGIVKHYESDMEISYCSFDKSKVYDAIVMLANELIPCLDEKNRAKVNTSLIRIGFRTSDDGYIDQLLNDVSNYAKIPRPRGYGKRVNEITEEIKESFKVLPKLRRYDIIEKILHILIEAGPDLKPINGYRWLDELFVWGDKSACIYIVKNCPYLLKIYFSCNKWYNFDRLMSQISDDVEAVNIVTSLKNEVCML